MGLLDEKNEVSINILHWTFYVVSSIEVLDVDFSKVLLLGLE